MASKFKGSGSTKLHASPGTSVTRHQGKDSTQERLPNRHAMATLTGGSTAKRSMNEYSKATPSLSESAAATPGVFGAGSKLP